MQSIIERMPSALHDLIGPIQEFEVPEQGCTSDVVIVLGGSGRYVVKHASQPPFEDWLRREHHVLGSLGSTVFRTPTPLCYAEEYGQAGRSHWLVMEHIPGIPLRVRLRHEKDVRARHRLLFQFGEWLATIHNESVPEALMPQEPWLDRMLAVAKRYLSEYEVDGDAELLGRLQTGRPGSVTPCLIHGDFTLDNVLVNDEQISGVIDWCWGAYGDPRVDLAIATDAKPEAFHDPADLDAFYEGYAGRRLTEEEATYFLGLYEFF